MRTAPDAENLVQCTKRAYEAGFYNGMVLVDSDSNMFQVVRAKKARTLVNFSLGDLLRILERNPRWQVTLSFASDPVKISLEETKSRIFESFSDEKDRWEEMVDFEQFRNRIAIASSLKQIFDTFRDFHH